MAAFLFFWDDAGFALRTTAVVTNTGVTKIPTQILYMTLEFSEWAQNHGVRVFAENSK